MGIAGWGGGVNGVNIKVYERAGQTKSEHSKKLKMSRRYTVVKEGIEAARNEVRRRETCEIGIGRMERRQAGVSVRVR